MTGLYIILGIILFFVVLFSFKVSFVVEMTDKNKIVLKYLFLKITLLDSSKPEKEKKPKKEKKQKNKTEELPPEGTGTEVKTTSENTTNDKGNNLFKQLYIEQGYDGIVKMLLAVKEALGSFLGKLYKTFTINELYLTMHITGSDAADTAIKYGKLSSWLFPLLGKVASTCKMKKYIPADVTVSDSDGAVTLHWETEQWQYTTRFTAKKMLNHSPEPEGWGFLRLFERKKAVTCCWM